jgi:hypothetical protein
LRFKNVESATSQRRDIALKMAAAPCGAGPKQRLLMLATPRLRAIGTGSVTALRDRLFFCVSKKVESATSQRRPLMCIARGAAAAPFDAGSKFYTLYQFTLFC